MSMVDFVRFFFLTLSLLVGFWNTSFAQDSSQKYALMIGVTNYDHAAMNGPTPLKYPEDDATAIGDLLKKSGYEVEFLLGAKAVKSGIEKKLDGLSKKANSSGICVVGLFGHGVEMETINEVGISQTIGYFCPVDTEVRKVYDADGKLITDQFEPEPETLISIKQIVTSLRLAKAGSRVVLADCCRDMPNRARGRNLGLGANFKSDDLPDGTSILFGCKPGEKAFEIDHLNHGAFSIAFLQETERLAKVGPVLTGSLAEGIRAKVQTLTSRRQNPTPFITDLVDLRINQPQSNSKPNPPSVLTEFKNSIGIELRLIPAGAFSMGCSYGRADLERRGVSAYPEFNNDDERDVHWVKITKPFHLSIHEVTLNQFLMYCDADRVNHRIDAEKDARGGWGYDGLKFEQKPQYLPWNTGWNKPDSLFRNHPVVNVSWNDAMAFCRWLTAKEQQARRISTSQYYTLPTEAQWEYACRGGSSKPNVFSFGDDCQQFSKYGNVKDKAFSEKFQAEAREFGDPIQASDGYVFTSPVGTFQANGFGLFDMHGNVWEWCLDVYDSGAYSVRGKETLDPIVLTPGKERVCRGGGSFNAPNGCRTANRFSRPPESRDHNTGFRIALVQKQ
jgi:formylglycine-generating enzyme required for sulfatase activity